MNLKRQIGDVLKREDDLKDKLTKLEFLYELDPNKPLMKYRGGAGAAGGAGSKAQIDLLAGEPRNYFGTQGSNNQIQSGEVNLPFGGNLLSEGYDHANTLGTFAPK